MGDPGATRGYRLIVHEDPEDGSWAAEVPDLPGCVAAGTSPAEAVQLVADAIDAWIDAAVALGRPIPSPASPSGTHSGRFVLRVPRGLHGRLARAAEADGVSLNTWCATALAEAVGADGAGMERTAGARGGNVARAHRRRLA